MNLKLDRLSTANKAPSKSQTPHQELRLALAGLADLILPAAVVFGGIATAVSLYRSLYYGWYSTLFLHAGLYVTAALILIFHRRLPVISMFLVFLGLIAIDVLYSLYTMGLVSIGLMSLTVLCAFAGVFFGLRAGIITVGVGILAVSVIGAGICTGQIATRPDMVRHLTEPITWVIQIACFVMYVVPLLLTADFVQRRMVKALNTSKKTTEQLQAEIVLRRSAESALQESEAKYRNVVEHSLAAFYIVQDGLFRFVNSRFCQLSGYTKEEIIDRLGPLDLVHPEERESVLENLEKRLRGDDPDIEHELKAVRKDGQVVALKILGNSLLYNGRPAASGTLVDISKETILESQLRQAQKMEAIGNLAGGIAHDFNNLLTALTGYGTLLQSKLENTNPLRLYVDQILSASQKATSLIQSLLTFGRRQPITLRPLNINTLVHGTEELLKRLITEDILFMTDLTSEEITVMADPTQIDQILFNLVTNARDAMPAGGTLRIATKPVELDREFILAHGFGKKGRYILLEVSDTGTGMAEAVREKIFDPFFTTKGVGKGTGLGLSTVYGIVKQHNGYITVYSEPDQGTAFHVFLPVINARDQERRVDFIAKPLSPDEFMLKVGEILDKQR